MAVRPSKFDGVSSRRPLIGSELLSTANPSPWGGTDVSPEEHAQRDQETQALLAHIAGRLHRGGNASAVSDELQAQGFSRDEADKMVLSVSSRVKTDYQKVGRAMLFKGLGFIVLGVVLTCGTYMLAANGGIYAVTTGLFIAGGTYVVGGLIKAVRGNP